MGVWQFWVQSLHLVHSEWLDENQVNDKYSSIACLDEQLPSSSVTTDRSDSEDPSIVAARIPGLCSLNKPNLGEVNWTLVDVRCNRSRLKFCCYLPCHKLKDYQCQCYFQVVWIVSNCMKTYTFKYQCTKWLRGENLVET